MDQTDIDETQGDSLYARCTDGTLVSAEGVAFVDFDRQANSLDEAVRTAIADVNAAGFSAFRVEIEADGLALVQA